VSWISENSPVGRAAGARPRTHKGQTWAIDFIAGIAVLTTILFIFMLMWNTSAIRWNSARSQAQMEESAFFASESLLATPGTPPSWEMLTHIDGNVSAIGLVSGRNELNRAKLDKLVAENATAYGAIKARLGLERYQFGMNITNLGGNITYYTFGEFSGGALNDSISFERLGILDGNPVLVHMEVWGR
jgi:hypothetical protein